MSDLIDREAALNCFHAWVDKYGDVYTPDEMPEYQAIEALPSAQPELIRCKNCKHNQLPSTSGNAICEIYYGMTNQDGFCHMAERREVSE